MNSEKAISQLPEWRKHGEQYLQADPFEGDDS